MVNKKRDKGQQPAFVTEAPATIKRLRENPELWKKELESLLLDAIPDDVQEEYSLEQYPFDDEQPVESFGQLLIRLRQLAGFKSQDAAVDEIKNILGSERAGISKSMLSKYERGEVKTIKPQALWILAQLYGVKYSMLAQRWASERYHFANRQERGFVDRIEPDSCILQGSENPIEIVSLERLKDLQAELGASKTGGSGDDDIEVWVAAIDFLDDEKVGEAGYFPMVLENLRQGVRYTYVLPEGEQAAFEGFLDSIEEVNESLGKKAKRSHEAYQSEAKAKRDQSNATVENRDKRLVRFVPRPDSEAPVCYVLFLRNGSPKMCFSGLLYKKRVQLLQVGDPEFARKIKRWFEYAIGLYEDGPAVEAAHRVQEQVKSSSSRFDLDMLNDNPN